MAFSERSPGAPASAAPRYQVRTGRGHYLSFLRYSVGRFYARCGGSVIRTPALESQGRVHCFEVTLSKVKWPS
ncbi:hypothetical protein A0H81_04092 [Grifola frondosa]|uniref:Uncharacterized protein n=1 Tax=Grifola frondosa TaxID=5627 RepID=A0A1C7MEP0_GRIFR|nr:hypothetical protein A0H81_04092 [Grifola frondosa]